MMRFLVICFIVFSFMVIFTQSLSIWSHSGGFHSYSGSSPHSSIDHGSFSGSSISDHHHSDSDSSSSGGCGPITAALGLCSYSSGGYQYQTPIYGSTGYTTGHINRIFNVETGSNSGNYNGYSNNYWICVNQYQGQYYYSYTYGKYICDARKNNSYGQQQQASYPNYNYNNYYQNYGK